MSAKLEGWVLLAVMMLARLVAAASAGALLLLVAVALGVPSLGLVAPLAALGTLAVSGREQSRVVRRALVRGAS